MRPHHQFAFLFVLFSLPLMLAFQNCAGPESQSVESVMSSTQGCALAPANLRNPQTIDDVTLLVNSLPKPVTIPCVVENLPRPLKVYTVQSTFSGQPSVDADNPRIFILLGNLALSVTTKGIGRQALEFGQFTAPSLTVKAELQFPLGENIDPAAPYNSIRSGSATTCGSCHSGERAVAGFNGPAFASTFIAPDNTRRESDVKMKTMTWRCVDAEDPYRCELLRAVFVKGQAQDADFP